MQSGNLEVRLATNNLEIDEALALRYDVFNVELGEGLPESEKTKRDMDNFDSSCNHLIVLDKSSGSQPIVGTCRVISGKNVGARIKDFYSASEFSLSEEFYIKKDEIAEVGRLSIHKDYRNPRTLLLLFNGLVGFMESQDLSYLMGCASVHSTDESHASFLNSYFHHNGFISPEKKFKASPLERTKFDNLSLENLSESDFTYRDLPPLIRTYLSFGAKICGEPSLDSVFGTTDFLILFNKNNASDKFNRRYGSKFE